MFILTARRLQSLRQQPAPLVTTTTTTTTTAPPAPAPIATPPELEQTLTLLTSHRSVLGYILLSRSHPITIIRHSGVVFDGEQGRKYAGAIGRIVQSVQAGLEEVSGETNDGVSTRAL